MKHPGFRQGEERASTIFVFPAKAGIQITCSLISLASLGQFSVKQAFLTRQDNTVTCRPENGPCLLAERFKTTFLDSSLRRKDNGSMARRVKMVTLRPSLADTTALNLIPMGHPDGIGVPLHSLQAIL